jgi:signal transduction histidine kinase/ligand-binding sensor domain-containing protein
MRQIPANRRLASRKWSISLTWLLAYVLAGMTCLPSWALDRDRTLRQFSHASWTAKDGAPEEIGAIAQTTDGYLWLGAQRGLFKFDGIQFTRYVPPAGVRLPSSNIHALMATPDGGLLIAFTPSGVALLKQGQLTLYQEQDLEVSGFARDLDGRIWAGVWTEQGEKGAGLRYLENGRWLKVGKDRQLWHESVDYLFVDRAGTLWAAGDYVETLSRYSHTFQLRYRATGLPSMSQSPNGQIWMGRPFFGISPVDNTGKSIPGPKISISTSNVMFDRDGALWTYGADGGLCLVRFPERLGNRLIGATDPAVECMTEKDGLTDQKINGLFEDREGNIWAVSNRGVDRFSESHLVPVPLNTHVKNVTLLPSGDGGLWIGSASANPFVRLQKNLSVSTVKLADARLYTENVSSVYRDSDGVAWWGAQGGIWRQRDDRFTFYPVPKILGPAMAWEIFPDGRSGKLWVRLGEAGLFQFKDGVWTKPDLPSGLTNPLPSATFYDRGNRIWLGYKGNHVSVIESGMARSFDARDGLDVGRIRSIRGQGGLMFFGGELGLTTFKNGRFTTVHIPEDSALGAVTAIVATQDGALWLAAQPGIARISPADVTALAADPRRLIVPEVFGVYDGLNGSVQTEPRSSTAVQGTDGKLWFATTAGLVWIDSAHLKRNSIRPPVVIKALNSEQHKYAPQDSQVLPEGTTSLRIEYTALSLSIPEKVKFKYKLSGIDKDWQEGGALREAVYNNLGPGHYTFRVIAANNDGLWNEDGATLRFDIAPTWYQAMWFRVLIIVTALLLMFAFYRRRVHVIEHEINLRFEARMAERMRIARELHDTLLQALQGLILNFSNFSSRATASDEVREEIEQSLDRAERLVVSGRERIRDLRQGRSRAEDLSEALNNLVTEMFGASDPKVNVSIDGEPRPLNADLQEEAVWIVSEAMANARQHSGADRINLLVSYHGRHLSISVEDNGSGFNTDVASGKTGHFGLAGMRERSESRGGRLFVQSSPNKGTVVKLTFPAHVAYHAKSRWSPKLLFQSFKK